MDSVADRRPVADEDAGRPDVEVHGRRLGGFSFDLHRRNEMLMAKGIRPPRVLKTGTTIAGIIFKDGVVLGADTRATEDTTVADKNCEKIHYIAPNVYCCGAGTAADTENITALVSSQLRLFRKQTRSESRVVTAMTRLKRRLFQYQGHISAALVLGGVDVTGPHLYTIYPHGSTDKLPYVTMGSGSLAAMSVFETGYAEDMDEEAAKDLVRRAIRAGIFNDLGSGSNVDLVVIRRSTAEAAAGAGGAAAAAPVPAGAGAGRAAPRGRGRLARGEWGSPVQVEVLRGFEKPNDQSKWRDMFARPGERVIPRGATAVVKEIFEKRVVVETVAPGAEESKEQEMQDD